jgi:hypothetical protein
MLASLRLEFPRRGRRVLAVSNRAEAGAVSLVLCQVQRWRCGGSWQYRMKLPQRVCMLLFFSLFGLGYLCEAIDCPLAQIRKQFV